MPSILTDWGKVVNMFMKIQFYQLVLQVFDGICTGYTIITYFINIVTLVFLVKVITLVFLMFNFSTQTLYMLDIRFHLSAILSRVYHKILISVNDRYIIILALFLLCNFAICVSVYSYIRVFI
jgi:hypothetical protein